MAMNYPIIPQVNSQAVSVPRQPFPLREGQMFNGQIKKLFSGQMAEVQIGGQKLMAKLEVPMKAGDAYYFQVKSVAPELQIKVVSGPLQATEGQSRQLANLMESLHLPKSPEMQIVLNHFLKQSLPVTKDILLDAVMLLKNVQPTLHYEALNSIQKLVELKMPLTEANFNSMFGVETKEGLHTLLSSLQNALVGDADLEIQRKEKILSTMGDVGRITTSAAERALFTGTILKLLDDTVPREVRFQLLQLLKNTGGMSSNATLANLQSVLHSELIDSAASNSRNVENGANSSQLQQSSNTLMDAWKSVLKGTSNGMDERLSLLRNLVSNDAVLQQPFKAQLVALVNELEQTPLSEIRDSRVSEQISKMIIRIIMEQNYSMPFRIDHTTDLPKILHPESIDSRLQEFFRAMQESSLPVTKELLQGVQSVVELAVDGKVMKDVMQSLFKTLGFNYEAQLLHRNLDLARTMEMLKPQLVSLLQDSAVSPALRDAAEAVITRMNGPIMQAGESGMNQLISMQLPLELLGKRIDATIHWSGRKKNDGKIDADFARILFYLELESIKETVVDMQVQNRVVSVTVFNNDNRLREIGSLLQEKLKVGLESVDYRLSGVTFKNFEEEVRKEFGRQNVMMSDHNGVDYRI